jgi:hypothetical protein
VLVDEVYAALNALRQNLLSLQIRR